MTAAIVKGPWVDRKQEGPPYPDDFLLYRPVHALLVAVDQSTGDPLDDLVIAGFRPMAVVMAHRHALLGGLLENVKMPTIGPDGPDYGFVYGLTPKGRERLSVLNTKGERRVIAAAKDPDTRQTVLL